MSFTATNWAWEQACRTSSMQFVLVCLADYANREGDDAYPSIPTICRRTRLNERTVRKALKDLTDAGLIERHERWDGTRQLSTEYRLNIREAPPANLHPLPSRKSAGAPPVNLQVPPPADWGIPPPANLPPDPKKDLRDSSLRSLSPARAHTRESEPTGFVEFWLAFPRKVGRRHAAKAFAAALKRGAAPSAIMEALRRQRFSEDPHYQPHPTTWLNGDRWLDEAAQPRQRANGRPEVVF